MQQHMFYTSWYTWHQGQVETPWDFWFLQKGVRYKPRSAGVKAWDPDQAQQAFDTQNVAQLNQLEHDYVTDVKLMAFVPGTSADHVRSQVSALFPDAEFDKVEQVDAQTQQQILALIANTLKLKNK